MTECELTHLSREPIDFDLACRQHEAFRSTLQANKLEVHDLDALELYPDSTFVEDVLIALPELFICTRPGALSRLGEVDEIAKHLAADRPVHQLAAPATLDGGDVLKVDRELFVGRSTRTNAAGIKALASAVRPFGYTVTPIDVPSALHLKTAVTALEDDCLLLNPAWVDLRCFASPHFIAVASDEPFAGNCLRAGGRILMQASHGATADKVRAAGFDVDLIDISEFAKAEAGLTCMSIIVPDAA